MANGDMTAQFLHLRGIGAKILTDMAKRAMRVKGGAVEGNDAGGLLAAMLQGMQPQSSQNAGLVAAIDTENTALFMKPVKLGRGLVDIVAGRRHWLAREWFLLTKITLCSGSGPLVIGQTPPQIKLANQAGRSSATSYGHHPSVDGLILQQVKTRPAGLAHAVTGLAKIFSCFLNVLCRLACPQQIVGDPFGHFGGQHA